VEDKYHTWMVAENDGEIIEIANLMEDKTYIYVAGIYPDELKKLLQLDTIEIGKIKDEYTMLGTIKISYRKLKPENFEPEVIIDGRDFKTFIRRFTKYMTLHKDTHFDVLYKKGKPIIVRCEEYKRVGIIMRYKIIS
jgi:hypothetical protein